MCAINYGLALFIQSTQLRISTPIVSNKIHKLLQKTAFKDVSLYASFIYVVVW